EVRPRDGCPLRLGTYKIVASFDPSIARSPELAWIARFTPKSAEWRVGLRPEEVLPRHRFDLFRRALPHEPRTMAQMQRPFADFWLAEYEKDPADQFLLAYALSYIDDWDEIERLLLQTIAWLEAGGRFRTNSSSTFDSRPQLPILNGTLEELRRLKSEGRTGDDWHILVEPELYNLRLTRRDKVNENTVYPPVPPKIYPSYCQLPMQP
ncbi:MAG: hypothetical protein HYV63_32835, partial [Candidatus Schekmanbacteria bacterium]|nr:hypothetical protein [Candidatus Schekmanbacteria bacterium]